MFGSRSPRVRRARLVPIALTTAALSSAVLGASVTGTLSAFEASITNNSNSAIAGSLVMKETSDGKADCLSSSGANNTFTSCNTINKYGGTDTAFIPDATHDTSVFISNTGTSTVTGFSLTPDACTRTYGSTATSGNLCDSLELNLTCAPVPAGGPAGAAVSLLNRVKLGSLTRVDIASAAAGCVPQANSGNSVKFTFSVHMPSTQDNTVQGQQVSQNLTWTFTGA